MQDDSLCGTLWYIPEPDYLAEDSPYRSEPYYFIRWEYLSVNNGPCGRYAIVLEPIIKQAT